MSADTSDEAIERLVNCIQIVHDGFKSGAVEREVCNIAKGKLTALAAERDAARANAARMREALGYYADQFCEHGGDLCGRLSTEDCSGCLARAALKESRP